MRVFAFDFDGVLCDSSREVFVVAVDTLARMEPGSKLAGDLRSLRDEAFAGSDDFRSHEFYSLFFDLLPLGNRAEDFGVALKAIEERKTIADQTAYNAFYSEVSKNWRLQFHRAFYETRERLRGSDSGKWLALHFPYLEMTRALARHRGSVLPAVATAKDAKSVRMLLPELGLEPFFDPRLILDKETGHEKTAHLRELKRRTGVRFEEITFIDDKLNHLETVAGLGVRGVLAKWGFNTERERTSARLLGYDVARLDDLDQTLFKGV